MFYFHTMPVYCATVHIVLHFLYIPTLYKYTGCPLVDDTTEKRLTFFIYFRTEVRQNQPCPQFRLRSVLLIRLFSGQRITLVVGSTADPTTPCVSKGAPASLSLRVCTGPCLSRREYPAGLPGTVSFFNYNGHRRYPGTQATLCNIIVMGGDQGLRVAKAH